LESHHEQRTTVHPLSTADGAPVIGYLHAKGGEKTAVFIMHPRELLVSHYAVPMLVNAGYACWVQGARTVGNDLRLEHELAVHDVGAGMARLKELDFKSVVLINNRCAATRTASPTRPAAGRRSLQALRFRRRMGLSSSRRIRARASFCLI
jgi:hypothetical protein